MSQQPPSAQQINPFNDLDGGAAEANLLGKTPHEAAALLEENSLRYSEDYTWMGPQAFLYYVDALQIYLESDRSRGDHEIAYSMIQTLRLRLSFDGKAIADAVPAMRRFCGRVEADFERLGFPKMFRARLTRRVSELESEIQRVTESSA